MGNVPRRFGPAWRDNARRKTMTSIGPKHRRHYGAWLATMLPLTLVGCQSGHVASPQTSDDGRVLVFQDGCYGTVYVADSAGVRLSRATGSYCLDPKGRWLLLTDGTNDSYFSGKTLTLVRLRDLRRHNTILPTEVIRGLLKVKDGWTKVPGSEPAHEKQAEPGGLISFFFFDNAELIIGPFPGEHGYWRWRPGTQEHEKWSFLDEDAASRLLSPNHVPFAPPLCECSKAPLGFLVEIPSDGSAAFRTIWIRPDGSPQELARKNDAPLCVLGASVATVLAPITGPILGSLADANCSAASAIMEWPKTVCTMAWSEALADLGTDPIELRQARIRLVRAIEERQSRATQEDAAQRGLRTPIRSNGSSDIHDR